MLHGVCVCVIVSLFAGVVPRTLWIALGGSIFLGVYDAAQLMIGHC